MAFTITANTEPATDGEAIWRLKELLVAAGWVVRSSGTGTGAVYSAAGDAHAPGAAYGGTLDLATSWFVIRQPVSASPRRELLFYRPNTTHGVWRIYYSSDGVGFTGGAPNATTPPTAADAPGGASVVGACWNGNSGTNNLWGTTCPVRSYRCDYLIGDSSEGFSFIFMARKIGLNGVYVHIALDVLQNAHASDQDPAVMFVGGGQSSENDRGMWNETFTQYTTTDNQGFSANRGWYQKGLGGATWCIFPMPFYGFINGSFNTWEPVGINYPPGADQDNRVPSFPMIYGRGTSFATQRGLKGRSRLYRYEMGRVGCRPYGDKSRWILGSVSIPWDGATDMVI